MNAVSAVGRRRVSAAASAALLTTRFRPQMDGMGHQQAAAAQEEEDDVRRKDDGGYSQWIQLCRLTPRCLLACFTHSLDSSSHHCGKENGGWQEGQQQAMDWLAGWLVGRWRRQQGQGRRG